MKYILQILLAGIVALIVVVAIRTFSFKSRQVTSLKTSVKISMPDSAIARLAGAVQIPTISAERGEAMDTVPFKRFVSYLEENFPQVHKSLKRELVNKHSLLYTWQGTNTELKPAVLLAHYDVVPAEKQSLPQWEHPPFFGKIEDGFVWGRGTMDDKGAVISILESVEQLIRSGHSPQRTVYLAFGHDEEQGGTGASAMASLLESRKVRAEFVLDEGGVITHDIVPGMKKPVALVGTSEKGFLSLALTIKGYNGGHSSMPSKETAIGILCKAVSTLEKHPFPSRISEPVRKFIEYLGPEMPLLTRMVFANLWLSESLVKSQYEKTNSGSATMKTTTAPTIIQGGVKDNVMPTSARAVINFRILPGETVASTMAYVKETINDPRITLTPYPAASEPSSPSPVDAYGFHIIQQTIADIFPAVVVAPYLTMAKTDARQYEKISSNIYRFLPLHVNSADLGRIHGINERISVENYKESMAFYTQLIKNMDQIESGSFDTVAK